MSWTISTAEGGSEVGAAVGVFISLEEGSKVGAKELKDVDTGRKDG